MKLWKQFSIQKQDTIDYFNTRKDFRPDVFAARLNQLILEELDAKEKVGVMFLCIGTDRSTGDSLGPLVGHKLRARKLRRAAVIGTLDRPVHAMNLEDTLYLLEQEYPDYLVIAVDASVGMSSHVGCITLGRGSLKPGLGVSKELQAVGDLFITGIVSGCGNYDPLMLQSIRLSTVMRMAECISDSICLVEKLWESMALV